MKQRTKTRITKKNPKVAPQSTINNNNINRVPRPTGTTILSRQYRATKDSTTLSNLYNKIIGEYVQSGFRVCGNVLSVQGLADYLNMPIGTLLKKVHQQIQMMTGIMEPGKVQEMASAVLFMSFSGHLEARHIALNQYKQLAGSQGDGYQAFISSEVNRSIANLLNADKNMLALYNTMLGRVPGGININNQNNNSLVENNNYLTTEVAVQILNEKQPVGLLKNEGLKAQLYEANQILECPEVIATKTGEVEQSVPNLKSLTSRATHEERNELDGDILDPSEL